MAYSLNSSAYASLTDAGDLDQGTVPTAIALTGITQAAGTATATTPAAHGLLDGPAGRDRGRHGGRLQRLVRDHQRAERDHVHLRRAGRDGHSPAGGAITATRPRFVYGLLGPGEDIDFRFQVRVNLGTGGLFVNNQATVSTTELPPRDTNLITIPIVGTVTVTGHVWLDNFGNDRLVQDGADTNIANVERRDHRRRTATSRSSRPTRPATGRPSSRPG